MDVKKVIAQLPAGYAEEAAGLSGAELRAEIVRAETSLRWVQQEMAADEKLSGARELLKDLSASYRDASKAQRAKIAYALHLLDERGELGAGATSGDADESAPAAPPARPSGRRPA